MGWSQARLWLLCLSGAELVRLRWDMPVLPGSSRASFCKRAWGLAGLGAGDGNRAFQGFSGNSQALSVQC